MPHSLNQHNSWLLQPQSAENPDWLTYRCSVCRMTVEIRDPHGRSIQDILDSVPHCDKTSPKTPQAMSLAKDASRYARATASWIQAGRPLRSPEEVRRIFENTCRRCKHYDVKVGTCTVSGERVRSSAIELFNKIRMATESCPKGHWRNDAG